MSSQAREVTKLIREIEREGWQVERGRKLHYKCRHPKGGGMVVISSSPSCGRAIANARKDIERVNKQMEQI